MGAVPREADPRGAGPMEYDMMGSCMMKTKSLLVLQIELLRLDYALSNRPHGAGVSAADSPCSPGCKPQVQRWTPPLARMLLFSQRLRFHVLPGA